MGTTVLVDEATRDALARAYHKVDPALLWVYADKDVPLILVAVDQ